jgi:hypothetical protein
LWLEVVVGDTAQPVINLLVVVALAGIYLGQIYK